MEINGKNPLSGLDASVNRLDVQQQNQRAQKAEEEKPQSDRIELSVQSREIQHFDKLIQSTPDVREARIEQLRSAVDNGTYNVKAERIAEKILSGNILDQIF